MTPTNAVAMRAPKGNWQERYGTKRRKLDRQRLAEAERRITLRETGELAVAQALGVPVPYTTEESAK